MKKTFVVTSPKLGWDCVIAIYEAYSEDDVREYLEEQTHWDEDADDIIIHEQKVTIIH